MKSAKNVLVRAHAIKREEKILNEIDSLIGYYQRQQQPVPMRLFLSGEHYDQLLRRIEKCGVEPENGGEIPYMSPLMDRPIKLAKVGG